MGDRPSMDDDDFDYPGRQVEYSGEEQDDDDGQFQGTTRSTVVQNQPHDEEVALSDTESFGGPDDLPADASLIESHDMDDLGGGPARSQSPEQIGSKTKHEAAAPKYEAAPPAHLQAMANAGTAQSTSDGSAEGYNALDYKHLNVSDETRELFKYIGRYKPHNIELETKLKPFVPDYIPAVGGIDEFIKVPRPDGKSDLLGLKVLDEPAARQSDPTVLTLQLRQLSKEAPGNKAEMIGRIEHTDEGKAKKIQQWVASIMDIHKNKPAATVSYSRRMPDIETLMQEWPVDMEAFLKNMKMPTGDLDLDLKAYSKLICSILDIPVYDNPVESLHVLFTLYLEFRNNPIFKQELDMEHRLRNSNGPNMDDGSSSTWRAVSAGSGMGIGGMTLSSGPSESGANVMTFA